MAHRNLWLMAVVGGVILVRLFAQEKSPQPVRLQSPQYAARAAPLPAVVAVPGSTADRSSESNVLGATAVCEEPTKTLAGYRALLNDASPETAGTLQGCTERDANPLQTTLDADGHFSIPLVKRGTKSAGHVGVGWLRLIDAFGVTRFAGAVPLTPDVVVPVRTLSQVSGRMALSGVDNESVVGMSMYAVSDYGDHRAVVRGEWEGHNNSDFALPFDDSTHEGVSWWLVVMVDACPALYLHLDSSVLSKPIQLNQQVAITSLRVCTSDSAPLPGATVGYSRVDVPNLLPWGWSVANDNGEVRIRSEAATMEFCVGAAGYLPVVARFDVGTEDRHAPIQLAAAATGCEVKGTVKDVNGTPLGGAVVTLLPVTANKEISAAGACQARTGSDGTFLLRGMSHGSGELSVYHGSSGQFERPIELPPSGELEITLSRTGCLRSTVAYYGETLVPLQADHVRYVLVNRTCDYESHGSIGLPVLIKNVPPGDYNLALIVDGLSAYGETSATVSAGTASEVCVVLHSASVFSGRVRMRDGTPVARADVTLVPNSWIGSRLNDEMPSRTGADGRFSLRGGLATEGVLEVTLSPGRVQRFPVKVGPGQDLTVESE